MYFEFFGLKAKPFSLTPDPRFLYESETHRAGLDLFEYGLMEEDGIIVLTGEVGTGKTTLVRHMIENLGDGVVVGSINNTHRSFGNMLEWIALSLNLPVSGQELIETQRLLDDYLRERRAEGKRVLIIIDEAQNLSTQALEQIRLLSNLNDQQGSLLQLLLVGQPELRDRLQFPKLRQFVQRIAIDYNLQKMSSGETTNYLKHRLAVVGGDPGIFTEEACRAIHWFTFGVPRLVNTLAHLSLVSAFGADLRIVDFGIVAETAKMRNDGGLGGLRHCPNNLSGSEIKAMIVAGS